MSKEPSSNSELSARKITEGLVLGGANYAFNLGFVILVARLAPSTHDFGVFISAKALLSSLSLLVGLGLDATAISKGYRYFLEKRFTLLKALRNLHLIWVFMLGGLLAVLAFLHWGLRENFYSVPTDVDAFFLVGWAAAAASIEASSIALLTACDRPMMATLLDKGLANLLTLVVGVSLLWVFNPNHAVWALGGVVIANVVLALVCTRTLSKIFHRLEEELPTPPEHPPVKEWVRDGLLQNLIFLLTMAVQPLFIAVSRLDRSDLALVGAFGALFVSARVVLIPFSGIRYMVNRRFDELIVDQNAPEIWRELRKICGGVGLLSGGFAVVSVLFGPRLLSAFGPSFAVYDWELAAICLGMGFTEAAKTTALVPVRTGQTIKLAANAAACLPIGLLITGAASVRDSIAGMAAGFLIFAALQFGLTVRITRNITSQWPAKSSSR